MIYLGGYSSRGGQGIGVAALRDGGLTLQATVACPDDPTFLAAAPDHRTLYACWCRRTAASSTWPTASTTLPL